MKQFWFTAPISGEVNIRIVAATEEDARKRLAGARPANEDITFWEFDADKAVVHLVEDDDEK